MTEKDHGDIAYATPEVGFNGAVRRPEVSSSCEIDLIDADHFSPTRRRCTRESQMTGLSKSLSLGKFSSLQKNHPAEIVASDLEVTEDDLAAAEEKMNQLSVADTLAVSGKKWRSLRRELICLCL